MEDFVELEKEFLEDVKEQVTDDRGIHDDSYADWTCAAFAR